MTRKQARRWGDETKSGVVVEGKGDDGQRAELQISTHSVYGYKSFATTYRMLKMPKISLTDCESQAVNLSSWPSLNGCHRFSKEYCYSSFALLVPFGFHLLVHPWHRLQLTSILRSYTSSILSHLPKSEAKKMHPREPGIRYLPAIICRGGGLLRCRIFFSSFNCPLQSWRLSQRCAKRKGSHNASVGRSRCCSCRDNLIVAGSVVHKPLVVY